MHVDKETIASGLRELGLREGEVVLLHSSLASLGRVEGGPQTVVDAFLEVLGPEGTLVVPGFGELGAIVECVKAHPRAVRSIHPIAEVAAIGVLAEAICRDHWRAPTAHAEDTPYFRIAEIGGYVCLLGVDQDRNTTLHTVEEMLRLPYLQRTDEHTFETPAGQVTRSWELFPGPHRNFIGLDRRLRQSGTMRIGRIGNSVVRLIRAGDLIEVAQAAGLEDPAFVLCGNPQCGDCVRQRAALRRHRWAHEAFTLVASSALAGRYVPEMIENLQAAGVDSVELDVIQGQPAWRLDDGQLSQAVQQFKDAGIAIAALRCPAVCDQRDWMARAMTAGVQRVVVPLHDRVQEDLAAAAKAGLAADFVNTDLTSRRASRVLLDLATADRLPGFVFNAAAFATLGEKPFLESYKQKLRRFVVQLDVEDATFSGSAVPLAEGNAEIKEMISILRCASFPGRLLLGPRNRCRTDNAPALLDCVSRFEELLDNM